MQKWCVSGPVRTPGSLQDCSRLSRPEPSSTLCGGAGVTGVLGLRLSAVLSRCHLQR